MEDTLRQLVYFSTAAGPRQSTLTLASILTVSRDRNRQSGLTGLLVAGGNRYLQVIEGQPELIDATMERIHRDDRHLGVSVLVDRLIEQRSFDTWSMAFCENPRLEAFATLGDLVNHLRGEVSDPRLRAQLECFASTFVVPPSTIAPSPWTVASGYEPRLAFDPSH
jgi:Sensors of blue-light using FAD